MEKRDTSSRDRKGSPHDAIRHQQDVEALSASRKEWILARNEHKKRVALRRWAEQHKLTDGDEYIGVGGWS